MKYALKAIAWWVSDYSYAIAWQTRSLCNRTHPESFRSGDLTPILVLPGIYETWKFMQPTIEAVHARGHPVHVLNALRYNHRPVDDIAAQVSTYISDHGLRDIVIIAHSKGGLVGKRLMMGIAGASVRSMLAVATPFGGSRYARMMLVPALRNFSPGNATIVALAREATVNGRIVSLYGRFDPHIPEGSELPGAKNVMLDTGGHFRILADPRVMAELKLLAD